jgi:transcriptional regulator with XRE-family HTH domain
MVLKERFASRARAVREAKGWGVREAARHWGKHGSYICLLESGEHNPTLGTVEELAALYGVDPTELLT